MRRQAARQRDGSIRCGISRTCALQGHLLIGPDEEEDANHTMRTATGTARTGTSPAEIVPKGHDLEDLLKLVTATLDDAKAEKIVTIDLKGKSSMGDYMIVASGRTDRHVGAIADQLQKRLKEDGYGDARVEGEPQCDWVLVDIGSIIVHVFRPEVREFYNLEKMWSQSRSPEPTSH